MILVQKFPQITPVLIVSIHVIENHYGVSISLLKNIRNYRLKSSYLDILAKYVTKTIHVIQVYGLIKKCKSHNQEFQANIEETSALNVNEENKELRNFILEQSKQHIANINDIIKKKYRNTQ